MENLDYLTRAMALSNIISDGDSVNRVEINATLLETIKEQLQAETGYKYKMTNSAVVTYALINLLEPQLKQELVQQLSKTTRYEYFDLLHAKLGNMVTGTTTKQSGISKKELSDLKESLDDLMVLQNANLVTSAWLLQNRAGLFKDDYPMDVRDVFRLLRSDTIKDILDETIRAGISELDRQEQKRNN